MSTRCIATLSRCCTVRPRSKLHHACNQCDQIGRFLKVLGNKFAYKRRPKRLQTSGLFKKDQLMVAYYQLWILFRQLLERFGKLFNPASGHTVCNTGCCTGP